MAAKPPDRIVVDSDKAGHPAREGEILPLSDNDRG
jgi:hypothetical protein